MRATYITVDPWINERPKEECTAKFDFDCTRGALLNAAVDVVKSLNESMSYVPVPKEKRKLGPGVQNKVTKIWNGLIGMVRRNEVDVAIFPFGITEDRNEALLLPHPFSALETRIFSKYNKRDAGSNLQMLFNFQLQVWLLLLFYGGLIGIVLWILEKPRFKSTQIGSWFDFAQRNVNDYLLLLFGTMFKQGIEIPLKQVASKLIVGFWIFGVMILMNLLASFEKASLLDGVENIDNLNQIVKRPGLALTALNNSIFTEYFEISKSTDLQILYKRSRAQDSFLGMMELLKMETWAKIARGERVLFHEEVLSLYKIEFWCNKGLRSKFYVSKNKFFKQPITIGFNQKYKPRTRALNTRILKLADSGLMDYWIRVSLRTTHDTCVCDKYNCNENSAQHNLENFKGVLMMMLVGNTLAGVACFFEFNIHFKRKSKKRKLTNESLRNMKRRKRCFAKRASEIRKYIRNKRCLNKTFP